MAELLKMAIEAHGGLDRWNKVNALRVAASITGAIWSIKGQADALTDVVITAETKQERLTMDRPGHDKRTVFEPGQVLMQSANGRQLDANDNPRKAFEGQTLQTPWEDVHVAYFSGEAMWTYLNLPFLLAQPGFEIEELSSIQPEVEIWRRLKITFPDNVSSHTRTQICCFGPDRLLRRHDYTVDILGGSQALNYASDYRTVGGIVFPMTRRVIAYEGDYQPVKDPVLVAIDLKEITLL